MVTCSGIFDMYRRMELLPKVRNSLQDKTRVLNIDIQMKCIVGNRKAKSGKGKIKIWLPCMLPIPPVGVCRLETEHSCKGQVSDPVAEVHLFITVTLLLW